MGKTTFKLIAITLLAFVSQAQLLAQTTLTATPNQGCAPLSVTFTVNNITNPPYRIEWYFNDGSPVLHDTLPLSSTVTHTYNTPGSYNNIYIAAYDGNDNFLNYLYCSNSVQVNGPDFYIPDSSCVGDNISFCLNNGPFNTVLWNFGDGQTSTEQCPNHSYTSLGVKTVTVSTTGGSCGQPVTITKTIKVSNVVVPQPWGWTNLTNNSTCPGAPITFNTNNYTSYLWDFGDGNTSTLQSPTYSYTSLGTKTVTLTVTNNCGQSGNTTMSIVITNVAQPFPNQSWFRLDASQNMICPNSSVDFNAPSGYSTYIWNYGDGSPADTTGNYNNNHAYGSNLGTYQASVKVVGACGNDTTLFQSIVVSNNASFLNNNNSNSFNIQSGSPACPNSNVWFNAPQGYTNYEWDFGDNSSVVTSSQNHNNHTYGSAIATYTVSVKFTNSCGNDTTIQSIVVISGNAPFPNYSSFQLDGGPDPACPNSSVHFQAPWGYSNYSWNYDDGSPVTMSSSNETNHIYPDTGTYSPFVTIMNGCGNDTMLSTMIQVMNGVGFPNQSWFALEVPSTPVCPNDYAGFKAPGGYSHYEWNYGDGSATVITSNNESYYKYDGDNSSYTVSVKITNACGNDTTLSATMMIGGNIGFSSESNFQLHAHEEITCPNSSVYFEAPAGYTNYEWDFGDSTALVTSSNNNYNHFYGAAITNYNASVKITNGCGNDTTLTLTIHIMNNVGFPNDSWFNVQLGPNPACPHDQVFFNAPGGYMHYEWHFGDGDSIFSNNNHVGHIYSDTGSYTYTVKITNACGNDTLLSGVANVSNAGTFANYLSIDASPGSSSCPGDLLTFRLNPNGFDSYFWDFGDGDTISTTGENIQHAFDTTGNYIVTCTVMNGCGNSASVSTTVQVIGNNPINDDLAIISNPNPACAGDEVFFVIENGQPTTTYIWNFGDGSAIDTTIGAGPSHIYAVNDTFMITVEAINSCGMSKTFALTQLVGGGGAPVLTGDDGKNNWGFPGSDGNNNSTAGCAGDAVIFYFMGSAANNVWDFGDGNTGTATENMVVYGGDGAFPVTIIKHVFAQNGQYMIHLTLTNSCGLSTTDSMLINIGGNQAVNGDLTTSPAPFTTCAPIDFLAFGGATYAWNFGDGTTLTSSSPTVSHTYSTQGVYVASVLVTNGCGNTATYSKPVNVTGVGGPAVTLASSSTPTCYGGANASATVAATGGQEPYTYIWNDANAQSTATATNLSAGLYYVTVTDNIGCASAFAVSIADAPQMIIATTATASSCSASTGGASVSVTSGGNQPYTYSWSNGSTTDSIANLSYGLYTVTVTDSNGCHNSANVNVSEANAPSVTLAGVTDVTCHGGNNGAIDISVTGGNTYTYLWSNGATAQDIDSLHAGTYSVQVTSNIGCNAIFNATVAEANALNAVTSTTTAPTCGNFDGAATASTSGGTAPYSYLWDSGAASQTTAMATGLPAGTYTVTVTDANGCTIDEEISLSNSNAPNISAVITDISCHGDTDGSIDISVTGGTSPYLYTWNVAPPQTNNQDINTLSAGNYLIFVNDAQGCVSVRSYTIAEPEQLVVTLAATGSTCNVDNGMAMATVTGGTQPYTYLWSDNQVTQDADSLAVGSYTLAVTDHKGCNATATTTISTSTPTPSICLVTVDTGSVNNEIYWDKTAYVSVDSFIVYREVTTNLYKRIGSVANSELSMFTDTTRSVGPANGDPNAGTYRYKLQIRDACGNYSSMSPYHNTIYVIDAGSGQFTWNQYEIENSNQIIADNYVLICDTAFTGTWFSVSTVAGSQTTAADPDFAAHSLLTYPVWRIMTDWSISCEATRAPVVTSRSNKKHGLSTIGISSNSPMDNEVKIYPNPTKDNFLIEFLPEKNSVIQVVNLLGEVVYNENIAASNIKLKKQINMENVSKGVYFVVIEAGSKKHVKKVVIN